MSESGELSIPDRDVRSRWMSDVMEGRAFERHTMETVVSLILRGELEPAYIGALLVGMAIRGETDEELTTVARTLRQQCRDSGVLGVQAPGNDFPVLLDTCGTGGDGSGSFNISTVVAMVVAACGVPVAKHGNRAVSSRSGSADLLEALGVAVDPGPQAVMRSLREVGIGFFFAPRFHSAMGHVAPVRRALTVRTLFNLVGPLANPLGATHQLLGVYDPDRVEQMARVLGGLGVTRAWVVHGEGATVGDSNAGESPAGESRAGESRAGGLDEVSPVGITHVAEWDKGHVHRFELQPSDFGFDGSVGVESLAGGDAEENAAIALQVCRGEPVPQRVAVVMNGAAALCVAGKESTLLDARRRIDSVLDSGAVIRLLGRWKNVLSDSSGT